MSLRHRLVLCAFFVVAAAPLAQAVTLPSGFIDETFARGLSSPTAMDFALGGRLFITEQGGTVRVVKEGVCNAAFGVCLVPRVP